MMGDKEINVDKDDNIHVDEVTFKGTKGLWRLVMMKKPDVYHKEDIRDYQELTIRKSVLDVPHTTNAADRPRNTSKYTFLTQNFTPVDSDEDKEREGEEKKMVPALFFSQVI